MYDLMFCGDLIYCCGGDGQELLFLMVF